MLLPDPRVVVIRKLLKGRVDVDEAALLLDLSARSVRRLRERFVESGPEGLRHGNSRRRPAHALDPALAARVVAFAKDGYSGLNDSHLRDLLEDRRDRGRAVGDRRELALVAAVDGAVAPCEDRPQAEEVGVGGERAPEVLQAFMADRARVLVPRPQVVDRHQLRRTELRGTSYIH